MNDEEKASLIEWANNLELWEKVLKNEKHDFPRASSFIMAHFVYLINHITQHMKHIMTIMSYYNTHHKLLDDYVFKGYTFAKMDLDPLDVPDDVKHGVPPLWNILLGETMQKQEQFLAKLGVTDLDKTEEEKVQMSFVSEENDKTSEIFIEASIFLACSFNSNSETAKNVVMCHNYNFKDSNY